MQFKTLREQVYEANVRLHNLGLAPLTWGNASQFDRNKGLIAIKPSGVPYGDLKPESMAVLDENGTVIDAPYRPSSDTPTHIALYQKFPVVNGVVHTHSKNATCFAQAGREIPCLGTTHADTFFGSVPITRPLKDHEIEKNYEHNTGLVIAEHFAKSSLDPIEFPGVLVHFHGPFVWGQSVDKAVETALILENVAEMAFETELLNGGVKAISSTLLEKHFLRKHGSQAYYGQTVV